MTKKQKNKEGDVKVSGGAEKNKRDTRDKGGGGMASNDTKKRKTGQADFGGAEEEYGKKRGLGSEA